ncbi:dihydroxyacetone kinase subunit DhaL [Nocardia sp. NBC_00508]|nr:dihydroxyacetone kinase subunit DhaL [Nocardia sp. NBC_00508]WUD65190.1 dihydroxyacetone kinase subunit DhaL [Nocardia sp. NBC_00508]
MNNYLDTHAAETWVDRFIDQVDRTHQELTELDRRAGDGDFGTNLRAALRRVTAARRRQQVDSVAALFTAVSDGFLHTGGTSGPLFGVWFRKIAAGCAVEPGNRVTLSDLACGFVDAVEAVQRLGHAEVGDNTMVDAMAPAARALTTAAERDTDLRTGLRLAAAAARRGAACTERMLARKGRASYVGAHAAGVIDPGALTVALFFEAASSALE